MPDMLPPIAGVTGVAAPFGQQQQPRQPAGPSRASRARPSSATQRMLTPSMTQIATQDVVVQLQGFPTPVPFKIGGRQGNAVTMTQTPKVHRGWRIVAVNGNRVQAAKVASAVKDAQRSGRYTVTFRLGVEDDAEEQVEDDREAVAQALRRAQDAERARAEEAERLRRQAVEADARRLDAEQQERAKRQVEEDRRRLEAEEAARRRADAADAEQRRADEERARLAADEAERRRLEAEEADRRRREAEESDRLRKEEEEIERRRREAREAAEVERLRLAREHEEHERRLREAMEEAERLERERIEAERAGSAPGAAEAEEQARQEAEVAEARQECSKRLQASTGLPPREDVKEPQQALLQALTATPAPRKKPNGPCDKCDGPHDTDDCPHFKKKRDDHADAWSRYGKKGEGDEGEGRQVLRSAKVVPQPGDGSCLFHSLAFGLKSTNASSLRAEIADYIAAHPDAKIADNPLRDWVLWDAGMDTVAYGRAMRTGSRWGGAVELAVCAQLKKVNVHVYERDKCGKGFVRISSFGGAASSTVSLLYGGRVHYDALQV